MFKRWSSKAFTLIELLVVVAIIALLISILLPSLKRAKDQAKKAVCLSNLRDIGVASHEYASEDERNMIMPLSPAMVRKHSKWFKRCVMWYTWGGRAAPELFHTENGQFWVNERNNKPFYGARQRPMTTYVYPDIQPSELDPEGGIIADEAPVFRCPADVGYPELPPGVIDDMPEENAGFAMYDTIGNSYRGSLAQLDGGNVDRFSLGVWGQRLDALQAPSRLLWGGDPLFYNLIGTDSSGGGWPEIKRYGWHGEFMVDNELYGDSSARPTQAVPKDDESWMPTEQELPLWGVSPRARFWLTRGPGWQIDAYPTPGVKFGNFSTGQFDKSTWPFRGHTVTPPPDNR